MTLTLHLMICVYLKELGKVPTQGNIVENIREFLVYSYIDPLSSFLSMTNKIIIEIE